MFQDVTLEPHAIRTMIIYLNIREKHRYKQRDIYHFNNIYFSEIIKPII